MQLNGLSSTPDGWSAIPCPVCHNGSFEKLFDKQGQDFVRCAQCQLILINPRPSFDEIAEIYAANYSGRYVAKQASKQRRAKRRIAQMSRWHARGRWLDVGCSAGFVLNEAQQAGFEPYGVDLDPTGLEHARTQFGIENLFHGQLEEAGFPDAHFQVISLYDVLEHVLDLQAVLDELRRILAADGILEIWTPDVGHWRRPRPLKDWKAVMAFKHLYYFDRTTLPRLLHAHGLQVVKRTWMWKAGLRVYVSRA